MEYTVAVGDDIGELAEGVGELVAEGFKPQGGVAVVVLTSKNERKGYEEIIFSYYQAMIKE